MRAAIIPVEFPTGGSLRVSLGGESGGVHHASHFPRLRCGCGAWLRHEQKRLRWGRRRQRRRDAERRLAVRVQRRLGRWRRGLREPPVQADVRHDDDQRLRLRSEGHGPALQRLRLRAERHARDDSGRRHVRGVSSTRVGIPRRLRDDRRDRPLRDPKRAHRRQHPARHAAREMAPRLHDATRRSVPRQPLQHEGEPEGFERRVRPSHAEETSGDVAIRQHAEDGRDDRLVRLHRVLPPQHDRHRPERVQPRRTRQCLRRQRRRDRAPVQLRQLDDRALRQDQHADVVRHHFRTRASARRSIAAPAMRTWSRT